MKRFINATFPPEYPHSLPTYLFYDNNCQLLKHVRVVGDTRLSHIGMPVDVFHALTKHKDSDTFCQENCNPAGFPELSKPDGSWIFNSSAAEQTNVWIGRFTPIVKEMNSVRYCFFLDEAITDHNEFQEGVLQSRGKRPRLVPLDDWLRPRL